MTLSKTKLAEMIEEATMDCYDSYEEICGWQNTIDEKLQFPCKAELFGEEVKVTGIDMNTDSVVAICKRNKIEQRIDILELKFDEKHTPGYEWIEAYRIWKNGEI